MPSQPNGLFCRIVAVAVTFCIQCSAIAGDLRFVQVASTSNPSVADFTKSLNTGIELAFNRVNRSGELKAGMLKLMLQDDQFSTSQAVEIVKRVAKEPDVLGADWLCWNAGTYRTEQKRRISRSELGFDCAFHWSRCAAS
jgi:hypothetical protein